MEKAIPVEVLKVLIEAASQINWDLIGVHIPRKKMTRKELIELKDSLLEKMNRRYISTLYLQYVLRKELNGVMVLDPAMPYTIEDIAEAKRTRGLSGTSTKTIRAHVRELKFSELYIVADRGKKKAIGGQTAFYNGSEVRLYVIGELLSSSIARNNKEQISKILDEKPHIQTNKELQDELIIHKAQKATKMLIKREQENRARK